MIKPNLNFRTKENFFVVPQETLIEVLDLLPVKNTNFTPSIKRKIIDQYESLSKVQIKELSNAKEDKATVISSQDIEVLDTLIDFWKFHNYKEKLQLAEKDLELMQLTLKQRASISSPSHYQFKNMEMIKSENPRQSHARHLLGAYGSGLEQSLRFKYGFHHWFDPELGRDKNSYINFLDLSYFFQSHNYIFEILDLLSLQNYNSFISSWSWRIKLNSVKKDDELSQSATGAFGFGNRVNSFQWFSLLAAKSYHYDNKSYIIPNLNLGIKYHLTQYRLVADYIGSFHSTEPGETDEFMLQLKRDFKSASLSISHQLFQGFSQSSLGFEFYFD